MDIAQSNGKGAVTTSRVPEPSTPLASIVLITYNHAPYIRRSIDGMLQQKTSFPFELIIGEDCSQDNTRDIVLGYQRAHPGQIRLLTSDKNVGALENLRRCEGACRADYVCYCDGDDYWTANNKLQEQVGFLQANSDYAMCHTAFAMYYVETGRLDPHPLRLPKDLDDADAYNDILSGRRLAWPLTACVRRSVLEPVLKECPECYDKRFLMADTQRWLEISRRGKVKYFPEVTATRQALLESASRSRNPEKVLQFAISNKEVYDHYIDKYGCKEKAKVHAKTRCAFFLLSSAFEARNVEVAKAALAEYRQVNARIPLQAHLYYFGSRSALCAKLARPMLAITCLWLRALRRAARQFRSEQ
jgi:glycosyltransferase involved in cell wall biosynthesis